ncbi:hypothetical protein ACFLQ6_05530 [Thermoproteota archaeon]
MPRGRPNTTIQWARDDSDQAILEELKRFPDGLRIVGLTKLLKDRVHKNTIRRRLHDLIESGAVSRDEKLKRYKLTEKKGPNMIRELEISRIIRDAHERGFSLDELAEGISSRFYIYFLQKKKQEHTITTNIAFDMAGNNANRCLNAIFSYAKQKKLIHPDYLEGKKNFNDLPVEVLRNIWRKLFPIPAKIVVVDLIETKELLEYLESALGKEILNVEVAGDEDAIKRYQALREGNFDELQQNQLRSHGLE